MIGKNIAEFEAGWLEATVEREVYFQAFDQPMILRHLPSVAGALAALEFGRYTDFGGAEVHHERAIWLKMIVSEQPGAGSYLLKKLTRGAGLGNLSIVGTPVAMKPRNWDASRPFSVKSDVLIGWYMRRGFRVIQDASETRVVFSATRRTLQTSFSLVE